jgi:tRNA nucleotidyltransferase/poly(A) polymerase
MARMGFRPVGRDFPVFLHPQSGEEYALARTERKTARGYRGFVVHAAPEVTLEEDLRRRDLSINAMALDLVSGTLLDPHGGQADLKLRQLRFLHHGSVRDDPTRLVRGARYAARLGLELDALSADQAAATLAQWPWPWRQGDPPAEAPSALGTRLRMELELKNTRGSCCV